MEGRTFHATDMNCGEGEFKGLDKPTSDKMYRALIDSIIKRAEFGIALSASTRDISVRWPGLEGLRNAYSFCCTLLVRRIAYHIEHELRIKSRVAYIFESGHKHQGAANQFMNSISVSERKRDLYHYLSHNFVGKSDMTLLQTADLLAWEWCKHTSRLDKKLPPRRSLQAILTRMANRLIVGHLSKEDLEADLTKFNRVEEVVSRILLEDKKGSLR